MKPFTKLQGACMVLLVAVLACSQQGARQETPIYAYPTDESGGLGLVEAFATGTSVALTQTAQAQVMGTIAAFAAGTTQAMTAAVTTPEPVSHDHDSLIPVLMVILPDGKQETFTYSLLEQLSTHTLDLFDKPRPAIYLTHLLDQAGWQEQTNFSVTLEGRTSITFLVDRLPEGAALWLDDGRVHFMAGAIPVDEWPMDVALIVLH